MQRGRTQHRFFVVLFIILLSDLVGLQQILAQVPRHSIPCDSLRINRTGFGRFMNQVSSTRAYQMTHIAVPLIVSGLITQHNDHQFRSLRNTYLLSFYHRYDDYLQYAPAGLLLGLKIGGVEGRSSWGRMLVSDAFSAVLLTAMVRSLKSAGQVTRPDNTDRHSFPSGHTATAFLTATLLHKEYGRTRSPWYSVGGYVCATATGLSRMINNKHWLSDALAGAGIGILCGELGYYLADLIFKDRGLLREELPEPAYDLSRRPSFLGLYLGYNLFLNRTERIDGTKISFSSGGNAGLEGAWFINNHFGFGGRMTAMNLSPVVDGTASQKQIELICCYLGAYYSLPLTCKWQIGTKLLAGYNHTGILHLHERTIGNRNLFGMSTGLSLTFIAHHNFGMRLFSDYTFTPSLLIPHGKTSHILSLGGGVNLQF